ncbi:MAG: helix-turn-helix transcriptional regulator [Thermomicrobiales bacterium]
MNSRETRLAPPLPSWTLVTSHGLALLYIATHPQATGREIASALEVTERRVADLVRDLAEADYIVVTRQGRRNVYSINPESRFRHPLVADIPFGAFIRLWRLTHLNDGDARASAAYSLGIEDLRPPEPAK